MKYFILCKCWVFIEVCLVGIDGIFMIILVGINVGISVIILCDVFLLECYICEMGFEILILSVIFFWGE